MICLKGESHSNKEMLSELMYKKDSKRRSVPEEVVIEYGDGYVLVAYNNDFIRTVPCFTDLKSALELVIMAVKNNHISESFLSDITKLPNSWVLTFQNWASFEISDSVYLIMENEYGEKENWTYSSLCEIFFERCD